jgi:hypothetical protein
MNSTDNPSKTKEPAETLRSSGWLAALTETADDREHDAALVMLDDLRAALRYIDKLECASRENLISARIIDAENNQRGHIYAITRDAKFILARTEAALYSANKPDSAKPNL